MVLAELYEDFEDRDGLESKIFLNDVRQEVQTMRAKALPPMKTKDEARDELEEIENLMEKLKKTKTRQERRRMLAQFNRKQASMAWG